MKKNYEVPAIDVVVLDAENMIAISGTEIKPGQKPSGGFGTNKYQGGWRHEEWTKIN